MSKTLARQFVTVVEETCAPFQFALSTRAGTDCVGHAIRAAIDADHEATLLSIDGVGAYDHVHRSAMLSKLLEVPSLQPLLPFVRAAYTEPTRYKWQDDEGHRHEIIEQHEGGEQGDPLMPLLFSLAIHNALAAVKEELEAGEMLFAFLDDIHVLSRRDRTRLIFNLLAEKLHLQAGIQLHAGKTRTWNKSGTRPPDVDDLGPDVWHGEGIKVLGTPVGSDVFVQSHTNERLEEENRFWEAITPNARGRSSCSVQGHGVTAL